jgi:hypothetical protein
MGFVTAGAEPGWRDIHKIPQSATVTGFHWDNGWKHD